MSGPSLAALRQTEVLRGRLADVVAAREAARRARLRRLAVILGLVAAPLWIRMLTGGTITWGPPQLGPDWQLYLPAILLVGVLAVIIVVPLLGAGRSPHVTYRPSEVDVTLHDVRGLATVKEEVVRTLNLFLAHRTFREGMGGSPRKAVLFEGPPGTGKTHVAKALAHEAGVPFLFVSSSAFQSMYYGQTNRRIRTYFRALREAARREGGAIGFIEEIDAIGAARTGMGGSTQREGISGVVNELLVQLQSFDEPPRATRWANWWIDRLNQYLPAHRQRAKRTVPPANVLVIGATNRAADLDPALLRPGRFDRSIHFDLPSRDDRREIIDHYLDRKAHVPELDEPAARDTLAAQTFGYTPAMLEHLLDEALVWALRRGADALGPVDVQQAKLTEELGLRQPVAYTAEERRRIATHEAGHATVAYLVGKGRRLEVLSIVKRREALGLLAHTETDERFTRTRSEIEALIAIAMGGLVAEERWFGEPGTGVAGDLHAATAAAAQMVGQLGMGDSLVSYEAAQMAGAGNTVAKVLAHEHTREQVEHLLATARDQAAALVEEHAVVVEALRDALLARDELVGEEILEVIRRAEEPVVDLTVTPAPRD